MKYNNIKISIIIIFTVLSTLSNAQDTIVDLSIDKFITLKLNDLKRADLKEFAIRDSSNNIHYYKFTNNDGACKYSKFRPSGIIEISGEYQGNDEIEYYSIFSPNVNSGILEELKYYRIVPEKIKEWHYFDNYGKLVKIEIYEDGELVNTETLNVQNE